MKKIILLPCLSAVFLVLGGCPEQSEENAETKQRIATCQEVMQMYIKEANTYERDRKRLVGSCHISQRERTLQQWQCAVDNMKKGMKYAEVSDFCAKPGAK